MSNELELVVQDGVVRLLINRADKRNAMTQSMWGELDSVLKNYEKPGKARALVLEARGEHFSAGADVGELQTYLLDRNWMKRNHVIVQRAQQRLYRLPLPTIAAIRGSCFGGGLGLATACDFRVGAESSRFALTPAKLGLAYSLLDTRRLVDLIGPALAREMLFTCRALDAEEARRANLLTRVVPEAHLNAAVNDLLRQLQGSSPQALSAMKATLLKLADGQRFGDPGTRNAFDALFEGPDFAEGANAFLQRRQAHFELH